MTFIHIGGICIFERNFFNRRIKWENVIIRIVNAKTVNAVKIVSAEKMVKNAIAVKIVPAVITVNAPKKINAAILATAAIINR